MPVRLVGVVNVTPDSFSDGGQFYDPTKAVEHGEQLILDGADWLDIGGVATGPGSRPTDTEQEWSRIEPVIKLLALKHKVSVDTYNPIVAERACRLGAQMINDVGGGGSDMRMFDIAAKYGVKIVAMFSRWSAATHTICQDSGIPPTVEEIALFFKFLAKMADERGIGSNLICDPGMGFFISSDPQVSWETLRRVEDLLLVSSSILIGISRKRFLQSVGAVREHSFDEFDQASALAMLAICKNNLKKIESVEIFFRVHNVRIHNLARAVLGRT